jgi:hypothetical protein
MPNLWSLIVALNAACQPRCPAELSTMQRLRSEPKRQPQQAINVFFANCVAFTGAPFEASSIKNCHSPAAVVDKFSAHAGR